MFYILLDADNINLETFIKDVLPKIEYRFGKKENYKIRLYSQSNMIFKHIPELRISLDILCSKYKNKNCTDAHILFDCGKLVGGESSENDIIIVSNDKIFSEIVDEKNIYQMGFQGQTKRLKLNKNNLLTTLEKLHKESNYSKSHDIYVDDLVEHFNVGISDIVNYIQGIPELSISKTNVVYFKNKP